MGNSPCGHKESDMTKRLRFSLYTVTYGFSCGSMVKNQPANAGSMGSIPGLKISPGEGNPLQWQPTLVFLPGKSHGQKSLAGYSPLCLNESDVT